MRLLIAVLFGLCLADKACARDAQLARFARGDLARLSFVQSGTPAPATVFAGPAGAVQLSRFRGRVVVLNLWATWCAPCLKELPALDRLAARSARLGVVVLPVSQDIGGWRTVNGWWRQRRWTTLVPYLDKKMDLAFALRGRGLPVTIIYDRAGRQVARLDGPAAWDSAQAEALVRTIAAR